MPTSAGSVWATKFFVNLLVLLNNSEQNGFWGCHLMKHIQNKFKEKEVQ
jgi:hypothetical protein